MSSSLSVFVSECNTHSVGGLGSVDALQGCWVPQRTCYSRPSSLARITAYNLRMLPRFRFRYTQRYFDIPDSEGVGEVKSPIIDHRLRGCQMNIAQGSESRRPQQNLWRLLRLPITVLPHWVCTSGSTVLSSNRMSCFTLKGDVSGSVEISLNLDWHQDY